MPAPTRSQFPLTAAELARFRLHARRRTRPAQVGGHIVRRKGLSLEFREFTPYTPGDDYRHIDWRTSARTGRAGDYLVRSFHAEEQLTLAISIDTRPSMRLPETAPKLELACWLARALTEIALASGDRVILHRLFGTGPGGLEKIQGATQGQRARDYLDQLRDGAGVAERDDAAASPSSNIAALGPHLPPTSVWLVVSDLYFEGEAAGQVMRAVGRARSGHRWVILLELDSWPHERRALGVGAHRIEGPGLSGGHVDVDVEEAQLEEVERRLSGHVRRQQRRARGPGIDHDVWSWPAAEGVDPGELFRERFLGDRLLERLFMREA